MWLIFALSGFIVAAVVHILDKFILDKTISRPVIFVFYSTIFAVLFFLAVPFVGGLNSIQDYVISAVAASSFVIGLWAVYRGIQASEISHVGPLIGATIPVFTFLWGQLFLNEIFTFYQIAAISLLIFGSLVIAVEKSPNHNGFHRGLLWGIFGGFLWSIFAVTTKFLYMHHSFSAGFVWSQGMVGLCAAFLILSPAIRKTFRKNKKEKTEKSNFKTITFVAFAKFLGLLGLVLVQYAVSLGSVTLVYALAGVQYMALVIMVAVLSKLHSSFYQETYTRSELIQEVVAVLLIAAGLSLLVV